MWTPAQPHVAVRAHTCQAGRWSAERRRGCHLSGDIVRALTTWLILALAVVAAVGLISNLQSGEVGWFVLSALVIGLINVAVPRLVAVLSFPVPFVLLGIFYVVLNGLLIWLWAAGTPALLAAGWASSILAGFVVAVVAVVAQLLAGRTRKRRGA